MNSPIFAFRLNLSSATAAATGAAWAWSTGEVFQQAHATWIGLAVYEGPALAPATPYSWSVEERWIAAPGGRHPAPALTRFATRGRGRFATATTLYDNFDIILDHL